MGSCGCSKLLGLNKQPWRQKLCVLQNPAEQGWDVAQASKIFQRMILCFHHCLHACLLVFILEEYARIDLFMLVGSSKCLPRPTQCRPIHVQKYQLRCNASLFLDYFNNWIKKVGLSFPLDSVFHYFSSRGIFQCGEAASKLFLGQDLRKRRFYVTIPSTQSQTQQKRDTHTHTKEKSPICQLRAHQNNLFPSISFI